MATETANKFVAYIVECVSDPGAKAALRSGLGRTVDQAVRLHRFVSPWTRSAGDHRETVFYTVAALIAHKPEGAIPVTWPGNLGASIARCAALAAATRETSIHLLARQPAATLCKTLTRVVVPVRTEGTPVDFAQLLDDAAGWPWRRQQIGRAWLQSFYRNTSTETGPERDDVA